MRIRGLIDECFQDYKKPAMFISSCFCTWKCCIEANKDTSMCQNRSVALQPIINAADEEIIERYMKNSITEAIIVGGLEPFEQYAELLQLIGKIRNVTKDDIVIYTGFTEEELEPNLKSLLNYDNIIIKFGRYKPNEETHFDSVLGVTLASNNQYAKKIS